tara:strand:- start:12831 stop:13277 length:447 start_codon:yes stop_codon:yes gene_type:complete
MDLALKHAKKALIYNEVPIGALIVNESNNKILSLQHNKNLVNNSPINHAEILAIEEACNNLNSRYLNNTSIYVTLEPCLMCLAAISEARISKLYFGAYDNKKGATNDINNYFYKKNYYIPEIYGGINEMKCGKILTNFFTNLRKKNAR